MIEMIALPANKIATTNVKLNKNFSKPRRVWNAELSPPPKPLPSPAADCCNNITIIRRIDRPICIHGSKFTIRDMGQL